jgi:hypothetical protein
MDDDQVGAVKYFRAKGGAIEKSSRVHWCVLGALGFYFPAGNQPSGAAFLGLGCIKTCGCSALFLHKYARIDSLTCFMIFSHTSRAMNN